MSYREKIDPTRDGFQELWDSIQDPTIEMLVAGIQSKKPTKEQILSITGSLRDNHTLLDKELLRLGEFSSDYNSKWATERTYDHGVAEQLQAKTQSQLKRWREMLKLTTPRYKTQATNKEQSIYTSSYLTHRPYELDMWGPASYGTLIYDLHDEMNVLINHLEEGRQLCIDVMQQEQMIDQDPEWKEELHDRQFQQIASKNYDVIEKRYNEGKVDTNNRLYNEMVSSPCPRDFKSRFFHKPSEQECIEYVVTVSTLELQNNKTMPSEQKLWGNDFKKIKLKRFVVEHLDSFISVSSNGKFDKIDTLDFLKWCDVKKSTKQHEDSERVLFDHIKSTYRGNHSWYGWPSIFEHNKIVKESVTESIACSVRFERKLNRFLVESGIKIEDITGKDNQD